jgi:VWFA-related protein
MAVGVACAFTALAADLQTSDTPNLAISVRSSLVLVPALVKTRSGDIVFSLGAQDFVLTDNGIPQALQMEKNVEAQPLALAVVVQTGGNGASHLKDYQGLDAMLDAVIGNVPHHVAVVAFDSTPHLAQEFTPQTDLSSMTLDHLQAGDHGVAILDAIKYGIDLLGKQPPEYRRALVLFSETLDSGSKTSLEDAVRAVVDTNTAIYSFGFSSTKADVAHQVSEPRRPGSSPPHGDAYPAGGCMSRDPDADPDAYGSRSIQALDCATDLVPPLRLGRVAFAAAKDSLRRNVPEAVAKMTGGEYFPFRNAKTLSRGLMAVTNDAPNYYVLSFHPGSPSPGVHALHVELKDRADLQLRARTSYWMEGSGEQ